MPIRDESVDKASDMLIEQVVALAAMAVKAPPSHAENYAAAAKHVAEARAWLRMPGQPH